jgi:hypothetical protein
MSADGFDKANGNGNLPRMNTDEWDEANGNGNLAIRTAANGR